ncbi:MAG: 3-dehydroquinate synthase [Xanthomonadales bacterium]|nr:3-dehydroquinate synthase [Xanthomonadales bacterium]
MIEVEIPLGDRSYVVYIGSGLLGRRDLLQEVLGSGKVFVVTNDTVGPLYLDTLLAGLPGERTSVITLPDGESHKTLQTWQTIQDQLVQHGALRDATVVALGGGVVGDIGGFAAATYMRGIQYVQVPTTLLAQVDSSVGGKTGVNHISGKNLIGAFHQPRRVIVDLDTLNTLPTREYRAGLAEVIKYGLIRDPSFLDWLESHMPALLDLDPAATSRAIAESVRHKAEVVAADELEKGMRALLNLGHTFGHAIESLTGYTQLLHGEAVSIGMVLAARLSSQLGMLESSDVKRVNDLLDSAGLPVALPAGLTPRAMLDSMAMDKKNRAGRLRLILLEALGEAVVRDDVSPEQVSCALELAPTARHPG